MQLSSNAAPAITGGTVHVQHFGMQMNAKMFGILTDKLYNNKEGALIRELAANARDAHVEAGKADVPFDIKLPTRLNNTFYIRDYGTGIDPAVFYETYTNLGYSTKDQENVSIGAYGLGSKTPFALTDTYTINNYYKGVEYVYTAFKDSGMPTVTLIGEQPSQEPDGLKITFSIDTRRDDLLKECKQQLRFFDVKPNILGLDDFEWYNDVSMENGWGIDDRVFYGSNQLTVVMGGVPYPVPDAALSRITQQISLPVGGYTRKTLFIEMPLGTVDVPPSRETIEGTERSIRNIEQYLQKCRDAFMSNVKARFATIDNIWDAAKLHHKLTDLAWYTFRQDEYVQLKGKRCRYIDIIPQNVFALKQQGQKPMAFGYRKYSNGKSTGASYVSLNELIRHHKAYTTVFERCEERHKKAPFKSDGFILNDVTIQLTTVMKQVVPEEWNRYDDIPVLQPIAFERGKLKEEADALAKRLTRIGIPFVKLSELLPADYGKKAKGTSKPRSIPNQVFKVYYDGSFSAGCVVKGDLPEEGYYVEAKAWQVQGYTRQYVAAVFEYMDKPIYAIRNRALKQVEEAGKLVHIKEAFDEVQTKVLADFHKYHDQLRLVQEYQTHLGCFENYKVASHILKDTKYEPVANAWHEACQARDMQSAPTVPSEFGSVALKPVALPDGHEALLQDFKDNYYHIMDCTYIRSYNVENHKGAEQLNKLIKRGEK